MNSKILKPINQLKLYGYENYFDNFINLVRKNQIPNALLLTGPKGIGKSTFAFHFINYLFSIDEDEKYSVSNHTINENNASYKQIIQDTHPNFFLLENENAGKDIKVDQIRNLINFLNKSTYSKNLKIVLIDNAENLNINSSNALLKSIEEPPKNTFFFIIHDSSSQILSTVKSRCLEYKFHFTSENKKKIFDEILKFYDINSSFLDDDNLYFYSTPGNLIKYLFTFEESDLVFSKNNLSCILYLIERLNNKKDPEIINYISFFIEKFYKEMALKNNNYLTNYYTNRNKILNLILNMKTFNLDKRNTFTTITEILKNEK